MPGIVTNSGGEDNTAGEYSVQCRIYSLAFQFRRWGALATVTGMLVTGGALIAMSRGLYRPHGMTLSIYLLQSAFFWSWLLLILWVGLRSNLTNRMFLAWCIVMVIAIWYANRTPYRWRAYDWWGHEPYINFLLETYRLPDPGSCWTCYHPPLYFMVSAVFVRVFRAMPREIPFESLQYVSTMFYGLYLLAYAKMLEENVDSTFMRMLGFLFAVCIPASLTHSARIGNDEMVVSLWVLSLYWLTRWEARFQMKDLAISAALLSAGWVTKANAAVPSIVLGLTVITCWLRRPAHRPVIFVGALVALVMFVPGLSLYYMWSKRYIFSAGISANAGALGRPLMVWPTWENVVTMNIHKFLTGFAGSMDDFGGRHKFWNYFLKTALMGEWFYPNRGIYHAMMYLSAALLIFLGVYVAAAAAQWRTWTELPSSIGWTVIVAPLCSMAYWYHTGFSCSGDARYVFPIWIVVGLSAARLADSARFRGERKVSDAVKVGLVAVIATGFLFDAVLLRSISF